MYFNMYTSDVPRILLLWVNLIQKRLCRISVIYIIRITNLLVSFASNDFLYLIHLLIPNTYKSLFTITNTDRKNIKHRIATNK